MTCNHCYSGMDSLFFSGEYLPDEHLSDSFQELIFHHCDIVLVNTSHAYYDMSYLLYMIDLPEAT